MHREKGDFLKREEEDCSRIWRGEFAQETEEISSREII
jgi:hypothetical protein